MEKESSKEKIYEPIFKLPQQSTAPGSTTGSEGDPDAWPVRRRQVRTAPSGLGKYPELPDPLIYSCFETVWVQVKGFRCYLCSAASTWVR